MPVWYRAETVALSKGQVRFGRLAGQDELRVQARIGRIPPEFDPRTKSLTMTLRDNDDIFRATIPAGRMHEVAPGQFRFDDPSGTLGGLRSAQLKISGTGEGLLNFRTVRSDLAAADRADHTVTFELAIGNYAAAHTRMWELRGTRLQAAAE